MRHDSYSGGRGMRKSQRLSIAAKTQTEAVGVTIFGIFFAHVTIVTIPKAIAKSINDTPYAGLLK